MRLGKRYQRNSQKSIFPPLMIISAGMVDSSGLSRHSVFAMSDLYLSPMQTAHVVPSCP